MLFEDRLEAGKLLAEKLKKYKNKEAIVLAIPRGGLEVGFQISKKLNIPLDIVITKKIGAPQNEELAIGAVGSKSIHLNEDVILSLGISDEYIEKETQKLKKQIEERYKKYREDKPFSDLKNKIVIITDDGIATGATIIAAAKDVREQKPKKIVIASPVCSPEILPQIEKVADEVFVLSTDLYMGAVGACYKYFPQVSDEEVMRFLWASKA